MTQPTLRAFRLRLWLPLVLIAASALIFLILLGLEQHNHTQALQRFADQTAHEELLRTQRSLEAVLRRGDGSGLDGTLSGEHGIGLAKRPFIAMELSPRSIALQQAVKAAFDPSGVMNPGKILP